jgi:hypothetical protein
MPPGFGEFQEFHTWLSRLQTPIEGREFYLHFDKATITGDKGSAGLKYVMMFGHVLQPDVEEGAQGPKKKRT